jgi:hypothetical protein
MKTKKLIKNIMMRKLKVKTHNKEIYHRVDKIKSIGVLMEENELMNHIINYNKKNNIDYDSFEMKKLNIDTEIKVRIT